MRIRDHVTGSWNPASVKDVSADEPRSYNVVQPSGGIRIRIRIVLFGLITDPGDLR